jgi:hypothetical protein
MAPNGTKFVLNLTNEEAQALKEFTGAIDRKTLALLGLADSYRIIANINYKLSEKLDKDEAK